MRNDGDIKISHGSIILGSFGNGFSVGTLSLLIKSSISFFSSSGTSVRVSNQSFSFLLKLSNISDVQPFMSSALARTSSQSSLMSSLHLDSTVLTLCLNLDHHDSSSWGLSSLSWQWTVTRRQNNSNPTASNFMILRFPKW